ncbi:MAG: AzlC family ABC transporter permease [Nocardioidaceae bacterium]|nr:AzlC family ABC transporter permease [Nocardioidaceae bacterium]
MSLLSTPQRREILIDSLGVGVATGTYGVSFGAVAVTSGLSVWQACALSIFVFTGASQFALVGVVAAGGAPMSGAATALMLGTRNTLYGFKLASLLRLRGIRRIGAAQLLIDESTAMALKPADPTDAPLGFFATGSAVFVLWNLATLVGALAGNALGDPATYGLDAAVAAAFLALLWPQLDTVHKRLTAAAAVALALILVPLTRPGLPVIAAVGVAVLAALARRTSTLRSAQSRSRG